MSGILRTSSTCSRGMGCWEWTQEDVRKRGEGRWRVFDISFRRRRPNVTISWCWWWLWRVYVMDCCNNAITNRGIFKASFLLLITYSWYHFLSRYFCINWCAVPLNCCASFDIRSALSSKRFNLSPRSNINWWARLTSLLADVALAPSSCMFAFGPAYLATERFGLPLAVSPTVWEYNRKNIIIQLLRHQVENGRKGQKLSADDGKMGCLPFLRFFGITANKISVPKILTKFFTINALHPAARKSAEKSFEETFFRRLWHFSLKIKFAQHIKMSLTVDRKREEKIAMRIRRVGNIRGRRSFNHGNSMRLTRES